MYTTNTHTLAHNTLSPAFDFKFKRVRLSSVSVCNS